MPEIVHIVYALILTVAEGSVALRHVIRGRLYFRVVVARVLVVTSETSRTGV